MGQEIPLRLPSSRRGPRPQLSHLLVKFSHNSTTIVLKMQCMVLCAFSGLRGMYESCCESPWAALVPSSPWLFLPWHRGNSLAAQLRIAPGDASCRLTAHLAPSCWGTASVTAQNSLWTSLLKYLELWAAEGLKHLLFKQSLKQGLSEMLM